MTSVEVSHLSHVGSSTACSAALSLYRWENQGRRRAPAVHVHGRAGERAGAAETHLDGWTLHVTRAGDFEMSRGNRSFYVSGTDFPLACN